MNLERMKVAARAAQGLQRRRGVVGVFWGRRQVHGAWTSDSGLSVHVTRKRPNARISDAERIPPVVDGLPTDVLEVGQPETYTLTPDDSIDASNNRRSSIAAIGFYKGRYLALTSGHGVMPWTSRGIIRQGGSINAAVAVSCNGQLLPGILREGAFGHGVDYAIVELPPGVEISTTHLGVDGAAPYAARTSQVVEGEELVFWSASWRRGALTKGTVQSVGLTTVNLRVGDGTFATYSRVISVVDAPGSDHFTVRGDSGGFVLDAKRRVVGQVLGGGASVTYVLGVRNLAQKLGALAPSFIAPE